MSRLRALLVSLLLVPGALLWWRRAQTHAATLSPGMPAPDFALPGGQGAQRRLADYRGEYVLVFFFPRADTPGCTREARALRDGYPALRRLGAQVVGISVDAPAAQQAFAEKYALPFPLLSDSDGRVADRYGTLWRLGPLRFAKRHSFLIDGQGRLLRIYRDVDAGTHDRQVLDDLATVTRNDGA